MVLNKNILILEDNLQVLSKLLDKLFSLEQDQPYDFSVMVLTNSDQVETYINNNPKADFDIILLDRDCKLNKSFHILDVKRFGVNKVISISSVPEYNQEMKSKGVKQVVLKDFGKLDVFVDGVVKEVEKMISPSRLNNFFTKSII